MMPRHCANIKRSDSPESLHVVQSCFIVVPSFAKLSGMISMLYSGHDFYTENYKGE